MEIRRGLRLLPWFLAALVFASWAHSHGVESAVSNWAGPALGIARLLALAMVLASLWQDAPLRRDRFFATRPQFPAAIWLAKIVALMVMVVVPLSLADGYLVLAYGLGGAAVVDGALQSFVLHMVMFAACITAVAGWRTAAVGWIAAGIGLAVIVAASLALMHHPGNYERISDGRQRLPWSAHWCVASGLLFSIAGVIAMTATRRWQESRRAIAFVVSVAAAFVGGLFLSLRQPAPQASVAANDPSIVLRNSLTGGKSVQSL
jgi:hypothetical protein